MTKNEIPKAINPVISLGIAALAGAENLDEEIGLEQNPASKIAPDLYDLTGLPSAHVDNKWGWTYLTNTEIRQIRDGYLLDLPPMEEI